MMLELWDDAVKFGFTSLTNNPIFSRVHRGVLTSPYYKEYSDAKDFRTFDAIKNMTLIGIFSGAYLIGGDDVEIISSTAFRETMAQDYRDVNSIPECRLRIELGDLAEPKSNRSYNGPVHSGKVEYKQHDAEILKAVSIPIQTKGNRWELTIDPGDRTEQKNSDQDIVVIASLLDNPINLGGVSRVSEIMGVKTLTLANKLVTRSSEFASVSVHSEAWLDILEVPILQITSYLREMRVKGYLAVGIEQTDRSVVIGEENNWKFPKKTVLLLGTEKFGIPAELLGELDCCVEIPQKGMTRSMNVQTAAAVVLYEVTRQLRQG
jgi:tRNA guanosine-2'-O-methyltransferase